MSRTCPECVVSDTDSINLSSFNIINEVAITTA